MQSGPFTIPRYSFPAMPSTTKRARISSFSTTTATAPNDLKVTVTINEVEVESESEIEDDTARACGQEGCKKVFYPHLSAHLPKVNYVPPTSTTIEVKPLTPPSSVSSFASIFGSSAKGKGKRYAYAMDEQVNGKDFERDWYGKMSGPVEGRTMSDGL